MFFSSGCGVGCFWEILQTEKRKIFYMSVNDKSKLIDYFIFAHRYVTIDSEIM